MEKYSKESIIRFSVLTQALKLAQDTLEAKKRHFKGINVNVSSLDTDAFNVIMTEKEELKKLEDVIRDIKNEVESIENMKA